MFITEPTIGFSNNLKLDQVVFIIKHAPGDNQSHQILKDHIPQPSAQQNLLLTLRYIPKNQRTL